MLCEGSADERFGNDVGDVIFSEHFDEEDAFGLFSVAYHGKPWRNPFQFRGDAFAAGAVDQDAGVCIHFGGALLLKTEFF